jgi:hypothetical protein
MRLQTAISVRGRLEIGCAGVNKMEGRFPARNWKLAPNFQNKPEKNNTAFQLSFYGCGADPSEIVWKSPEWETICGRYIFLNQLLNYSITQ